jgi:hypothetical protein
MIGKVHHEKRQLNQNSLAVNHSPTPNANFMPAGDEISNHEIITHSIHTKPRREEERKNNDMLPARRIIMITYRRASESGFFTGWNRATMSEFCT